MNGFEFLIHKGRILAALGCIFVIFGLDCNKHCGHGKSQSHFWLMYYFKNRFRLALQILLREGFYSYRTHNQLQNINLPEYFLSSIYPIQ